MIVYFVRHGQHKFHKRMNFSEEADQSLTHLGRRQAKATAREIKKLPVARIIASPFQRTKETAEIIKKSINKPLTFDERIKEFKVSATLFGREYKEMKAKLRSDHNFKAHDGESVNDSISRFKSFLDEVKDGGENICVVTHIMVMQNLFKDIFSLSSLPMIEPGAISAIEYINGSWNKLYINKTDHLPYGFWHKVRNKLKTIKGKYL